MASRCSARRACLSGLENRASWRLLKLVRHSPSLKRLNSFLKLRALHLALEFHLEGFDVCRIGLVAFLFGIETETTRGVDVPFGGNAVAESDRSTKGSAGLVDLVDIQGH